MSPQAAFRPMGPARDFNTVNSSGSRNPYFQPNASYVAKVIKIELGRRSGSLVVEFEIYQSSDPREAQGEKRTWVQKMADIDVAYPTIKQFMLSVMGYGSDEEHAAAVAAGQAYDANQLYNMMFQGEQSPFIGRYTNVLTSMTNTRNNKPFTRHNFSPIRQAA